MSWVFVTVFQTVIATENLVMCHGAKVLVLCCLLEATSAAHLYLDQTALLDLTKLKILQLPLIYNNRRHTKMGTEK